MAREEGPGLWTIADERVGEFDAGALAYDRFRPRYPDSVIEDLMDLAALDRGARVLEVGCGTGIATSALVAHGLEVVGVEPAPRMAEVAQEKLRDRATIVVSRFEDVQFDGLFDAVVAFNAWHWVKPSVALDQVDLLLAPSGALAVVRTDVVQWGQTPFEDLITQHLGMSWPKSIPEVTSAFDPVIADGRFDDIGTSRQRFTRTMDAPTFRAVSHTYGGGHLPEMDQVLTDLIDHHLGGEVTKSEEAILRVARRL